MSTDENEKQEYDERLRWRLNLLKLKLEEGKINIPDHLAEDFKSSLGAVRTNSDGEIDLSTVNGQIRSMALAIEALEHREGLKGLTSLQDISSNYFDFLETQFGKLRDDVAETTLDIHQAALAISQNDEYSDALNSATSEILAELDKFWESASETAAIHIQDIQGTKGVFGGDLFPSHSNSIASSVGLYVDTIVLPDPIHRSKTILTNTSEDSRAYYLVKNALNALQYRDLALADVKQPIVVINPYRSSVCNHEMEFLQRASEKDALNHAANIFGRQFDGIENLIEFVAPLDTADSLVQQVVHKEHVLFDTDWTGDIHEQLHRALSDDWGAMGGTTHVGQMVVFQLCLARMHQATDILLNSRYLTGVPLIDAPTSWQYFNWKLEYNAESDPTTSQDLHMIKGLQNAAEADEVWLGKIPHKALIEMRRENAFGEIREMLSAGVQEIATTRPKSFFRSSDQVVDNIRSAFEQHTAEVKSLNTKTVKFAGYDIASMLVAGSLDLATIATGLGTWGAASWAVNQFLDVPKLKDIPEQLRELKNAHIELRKSPMGLFFKYK